MLFSKSADDAFNNSSDDEFSRWRGLVDWKPSFFSSDDDLIIHLTMIFSKSADADS
jgi:hypothetical protein